MAGRAAGAGGAWAAAGQPETSYAQLAAAGTARVVPCAEPATGAHTPTHAPTHTLTHTRIHMLPLPGSQLARMSTLEGEWRRQEHLRQQEAAALRDHFAELEQKAKQVRSGMGRR